MFIDHPTSFSTKHLSEINEYSTNDEKIKGKTELYNEKEEIRTYVKNKIDQLSTAKLPLTINISGDSGTMLKVSVKTPDTSFDLYSESELVDTGLEALNRKNVSAKLNAVNETEYYIENIELNLDGNLYLPFKELTSIKRRLLFILNDSKEYIDPIGVPVLKKQNKIKSKLSLSVLISSPKDLHLCKDSTSDIYYQLPAGFKNECSELLDLFKQKKKLIPWFPSVLIGEDYSAAVDFLKQVQAKHIVTNNTGIAYEACKNDIPWIAGPFLNIVNSYSLLNLKENFNCSGSFISNEINKRQIEQIISPGDFKLYYSIYHPIVLMTSRQCLFHQVTGCEKYNIDESCIPECEKSSSIKNLKDVTLFIEKSKGNYNKIYNEINFLNLDIVTDIPIIFSGFFIDLRDIKTETKVDKDKLQIIKLFEDHLNGISDSTQELKNSIHPVTDIQYKTGI